MGGGGGGEGEGASAGLGRGRAASPRPPRGGARRRVAACPALRRPARASLFPPSGQRGANEEVLPGSVAARAAPCPLLPARGGAGVPFPQTPPPELQPEVLSVLRSTRRGPLS